MGEGKKDAREGKEKRAFLTPSGERNLKPSSLLQFYWRMKKYINKMFRVKHRGNEDCPDKLYSIVIMDTSNGSIAIESL